MIKEITRSNQHVRMNRLSATGFALCDEQSRLSPLACTPSITSPRWRALPPASQAARSLMAREKQMRFQRRLFFFRARVHSFDHEPVLARSSACFAGCSFSNGTRKTNALSASLVFLSCSLYNTIGLKGNTVNGMTFKPIQIWYYSSLVAF